MLRRRRLLSIRPRRCSGRSKFGFPVSFFLCSRRWRFDAADFVLCGLAAARGCRTMELGVQPLRASVFTGR